MPTAPTQVRWPSRTTIRTVFQALVAVCAMVPVLVAAGLPVDTVPWLGGIVAVAAVVTRLMATPAVEDFLHRFLPWLSAAPKPGDVPPAAGAPAPSADAPNPPA